MNIFEASQITTKYVFLKRVCARISGIICYVYLCFQDAAIQPCRASV